MEKTSYQTFGEPSFRIPLYEGGWGCQGGIILLTTFEDARFQHAKKDCFMSQLICTRVNNHHEGNSSLMCWSDLPINSNEGLHSWRLMFECASSQAGASHLLLSPGEIILQHCFLFCSRSKVLGSRSKDLHFFHMVGWGKSGCGAKPWASCPSLLSPLPSWWNEGTTTLMRHLTVMMAQALMKHLFVMRAKTALMLYAYSSTPSVGKIND